MGCATCGKRYTRNSLHSRFRRRINMNKVQVQPTGQVAKPIVPPDEGLKDPSTGQLKSVIMTGSEGEAKVPCEPPTVTVVEDAGKGDAKSDA